MFIGEAAERLDALDSALLVLERSTDKAEVTTVLAEAFRQAHTIKGGSRAVGLPEVERLAHHLEDAFDRVRREGLVLDWNAVFAVVDGLRRLVAVAATGAGEPVDVDGLIAGLAGQPARPGGPSSQPAPAAGSEPAGDVRVGESVRVPLSRLDVLMAEVRELHAAGSSLRQRLVEAKAAEAETVRALGRKGARALTELRRRLEGDVRRLEQSAGDLGEGVRRLRLVPVEVALAGLPRLVRDLAGACGKQARLVTSGGQTEVDRGVLDELGGVLTHLVRNGVDHGIEEPSVRRATGKPETGVISVRAREERGVLVLEIADDGAGIDRQAVTARAVDAGWAGSAGPADPLDLIFRPGLSTAPVVSALSGRGVGLDVVAGTVGSLGGTVTVESTPGKGTTFTLTLPLGLATTRSLLVGVEGRRLALPLSSVVRVERIDPDRFGTVGGRLVLRGEGPPTPVADLAAVLGAGDPAVGRDLSATPLVVLAQSAAGPVGVLVDEFGGEEELVVKPLPAPLPRSRFTAGAAILGSGQVVPVLAAGEVFRRAAGMPLTGAPRPSAAPVQRPVVVVADDSLTTRTMVRAILEGAGYEVRLAADGREAFDLVRAGGCDAVVTDIEMPNLDGFGLCAEIRASAELPSVPVVLVTALGSEADRRRGVEVGADAYIVKGEFDQENLLSTLRRLV